MLFRQPPQPSLTARQFIIAIDTITQAYLGSKSYAFIREVKGAADGGYVFTPADRQWLRGKILFVNDKLSSLDLQKARLQEKLYTYKIKESDSATEIAQLIQWINEIFSAAQHARDDILRLLGDKKIRIEYCIHEKSVRRNQTPGLPPLPEAQEALRRTHKTMAWLTSPLILIVMFDVSLDARFFAGAALVLVCIFMMSEMLMMKDLKKTLHLITRTIENLSDAQYNDLSESPILTSLTEKLNQMLAEAAPDQQAAELAEGRRLMAS